MKYLPHVLIASGIMLALTSIVYAAKRGVDETKLNIQSIHIIGDSQTQRHIGEAFSEEFSPRVVTYFGREGSDPLQYLNTPQLLQDSLPHTCTDLIYIQLGDNGIQSSESVRRLIDFYRRKCPNALFVWGGPMRAVNPTIRTSYISDDPTSPRYLPTYNATRSVWNDRARQGALDTNIMFFDNYNIQNAQPSSSAFSNTRGGDGIHLLENSAKTHAQLFRSFLEGYNLNVIS